MFFSRLSLSAIELPPLRSAPEQPTVCYVTGGREFPNPERDRLLLGHVRAAIEAGADWVQIREKDIPAKRLLALTRDIARLASKIASAARIIVNDRLDVAVATGAGGVHLGGESISAQEIIPWCRAGNASPEFLIGVSCHSIEEAERAESAGADYVFFGPIFDTPSKRSFGVPQGLARLSAACRAVNIPVMAIGGITVMNAGDCIQAGAKGIAAIRLFQDALSEDAVREFVSQLHDMPV